MNSGTSSGVTPATASAQTIVLNPAQSAKLMERLKQQQERRIFISTTGRATFYSIPHTVLMIMIK